MATIAPPFILCPISDAKELLGVSEDREENKIILTLSKNIAIKYHVLEQKQELSWTSSRHWLTSRVIYCPEAEKYGAIIDHNTVALWAENDTTLSKLKKYKFTQGIYGIYPTKFRGTLIIFINGDIKTLTEVMGDESTDENKNSTIIDPSVDKIINVEIREDEEKGRAFIVCVPASQFSNLSKCGIVKKRCLKIFSISINDEKGGSSSNSGTSQEITFLNNYIDVALDKEEILGHCIVSSELNSFLLFMSSDGYLYQKAIITNEDPSPNSQPKKVAHFQDKISTNTPVVMKAINSSHVAIYASEPSEEGAMVFIYDFNLDLFVSRQSLKLMGNPPIMEKAGNSIFIPVGMNILVLKLRITKSQLSDILGQHQFKSSEFFETHDPWKSLEENQWEEESEFVVPKLNNSFVDDEILSRVNIFEDSGQPESIICEAIIPDMLEKENYNGVQWALNYFSDIPETLLVKIQTYLLSKLEQCSEDQVQEAQEFKKEINSIIARNVEYKALIQSFQSLDFTNVKVLLNYLTTLIKGAENWKLIDENESGGGETTSKALIGQAIKWTSAALDSHYIDLVYNDELELTDKILEIIQEKLALMEEIENLEPLLAITKTKTNYEPDPPSNSLFRTEMVTFE